MLIIKILVKVTVAIPDDLPEVASGSTRTYSIIRIHAILKHFRRACLRQAISSVPQHCISLYD